MTPDQLISLGTAFAAYLRIFEACVAYRPTAEHLHSYCRGLLSDLGRKSIEPIAKACGTAVRTLQEFLRDHVWDQFRMRDLFQQRLLGLPALNAANDLGTIGLIDETSVAKKGTKTPGVHRQYCGSRGKLENCIVTVHLGIARGLFKTLIDAALFLPKAWSEDRERCREYDHFATAIERLSQVTYLNDQFYDPVRAEHRKVSFGFLSYSLPLDPASSRAWRIAWDPIFFDIVRAAGGSFRFDLAVYRELDPASRRLFLLLSKIMSRRSTSPRFDVRHLAVNVLGFAPTITTRDLKIKVWRCVERLIELQVVRTIDKDNLFRKTKRGEYALILECGDYFAKRRQPDTLPGFSETALDELLRNLGFDDDGIRRLLRRFPMTMLREWTDITLAAKERFGHAFFKKSPQAYLVDNLKKAVSGMRTPPDWWHDVRRAEARAQAKSHLALGKTVASEMLDVPEEARQAYERIAAEMFAVFRAGGQPETAAKVNAEKFAREHVLRGDANALKPLSALLKN